MNRDLAQLLDTPAETTAELLDAFEVWERTHVRGGGAARQDRPGEVPRAIPESIPEPAVLVASVTEHLNLATPTVLPEGVDERRRWLSGLGDIYLALGAARRLAADPAAARPWAGVLAEALAGIAAGRLALVGHAGGMWLFGRLAENNLRDFPHSEPWKTVLAVPRTGEFDGGDQAKVVRYWALGELSTKNAEFVRESVAKDSGWRDAYRAYLQGRLKEVQFLDIDPRLLLHPVLKVPLPHLGQSLEISRSASGFLIRWADQTTVVDSAQELRIAGDSTTGPLSARVEALEPHLRQTAFQAVSAAAELAQANDASDETALSLAKGIADTLGSESKPTPWFERLRSAAAAFDEGREAAPEEELATKYALEARVSLELLAYRMGADDQLFAVLRDIDESLKGVASAVMLLDDDDYLETLGAVEPREGTWWGERIQIDERVRDEALDSALERWARPQRTVDIQPWTTTGGDPGGPADKLQRQPSAWLAAGATRAEDPASQFGRTPLLLVDSSRRAIVAELRIVHDRDTGLWRGDHRLRALALDAVRAAYFAVAKRMPKGMARYPLDHHRIDVDLPRGTVEQMVDGDSIGLPAALAFASLWLEKPLPLDLASTGSIQPWEEPTAVVPVEAVREKAVALAASAGTSMRLVCPAANVDEAAGTGLTVVPVSNLDEAFAAAALDFSQATPSPDLGDLYNQQVELGRLVGLVDDQRLDEFKRSTDPWLALGDRIRMLLRSLRNTRGVNPDVLNNARVRAALAFTHAGDDQAAADMLKELDDAGCTDPYARAMRDLIEMGSLIDADENDSEKWSRCDRLVQQLDRRLEEMSAEYRPLVVGRFLGSKGRSFTHRGQPERAIEPLKAAVKEHEQSDPKEAGRSRVYLAMALRMAGQHDEALAELDRAHVNIQAIRAESQPYHASCLMFWHYEMARLLVEMGNAEDAKVHAENALAEARWRGPNPRLGILRTLAWAEQLLGRKDEAESRAREIEQIVYQLPKQDSPMRRYAERVLAEVRGGRRTDGEIY